MPFCSRRLRAAVFASLLGGGLCVAPAPLRALTLIPAFPPVSGGTLGGDPSFSGSLGYGFSLSRPQTISALGFYDADEDGLLSSHAIGLFEASSQSLLASVTVPAGSGAWLQGGFRWVAIPGLSLMPGSYVVAASSSGDAALFDPFLFAAAAPEGSEGFVMASTSLSQSGSGTGVDFLGSDEGLSYGFVGPNLAIAGVPAPLPLLGGVSALAWSRRLRQRCQGRPQG